MITQNTTGIASSEAQVLGGQLEAVRSELGEMRVDIREMTTALTKLAALEQQHLESRSALERAFLKLEDHEKRMRPIEIQMPALVETRKWVITAMLAAIGMIMLSVGALVFRPVPTIVNIPVEPTKLMKP